MPFRRTRRLAAALAIAAVAIAGLTSVPVAAQAAASDIPPTWGTTLGTLHVEPTSGSFSQKTPFTRIWTDSGFSASQLGGAMLVISQIYTDDKGELAARRGFLLDINVIDAGAPMTGPFSRTQFSRSLGDTSTGIPLSDGKGKTFAILLSGFRDESAFFNPTQENYVAYGVIEGDTWRIVDGSAPAKTDTTTTLASSNVAQTSATLTATVAPSDATGTVQFKQDGAAIGSPVAISGGTASYAVSGLTASTAYAFTADYSGDSTHNASSGAVNVTTAAVPATQTETAPVSVSVPTATTAQPTGLKLTATPQAIALSGPGTRTVGQVWTATGELGTVTVDDDRQSASTPWTLNGRISAFTSGSNSIAASNVGWKPAKVGDGPGTPGSEVTAGSNGGLTSDKPLATGTGSASAHVTTSVGATITLNTPADAPAGNYTGTLTLTLI